MSSFPRCEALPARRALLLIAAPLTPGLYRPWLSRLDRTSETRWQHAEQESSDGVSSVTTGPSLHVCRDRKLFQVIRPT